MKLFLIALLLLGALSGILYGVDRWTSHLDHALEVAVLERHYPDTVVLYREDGFVVTMPVPARIYHRLYAGQHLQLELWRSGILRRSWLTIHPMKIQTRRDPRHETWDRRRTVALG